MENVYYPSAIRETALSSSEVGGVPEEAEAVGTVVTTATTAPNEPAKESEPSGAAETGEGLSLKAPLRAVESTVEAQAPHVEEPAFSIQPLQTVPPSEGSKGPEVTPTQLPKEGVKIKLKK